MSLNVKPAHRGVLGTAVNSKQPRNTGKGTGGKTVGNSVSSSGNAGKYQQPTTQGRTELEKVEKSKSDHLVQVEQPEPRGQEKPLTPEKTSNLGKRLRNAAGSRKVHPVDDSHSTGADSRGTDPSADELDSNGPSTADDGPSRSASAQRTSTLWTSVRAVVNFNSTFMSKKRKNVPTQRVDSFLEKFTIRRRENSMYDDEDSERNGKTAGGGKDRDDELLCQCTVDPDGNWLFYWLCLVVLAVEYNIWFLIAREAWPGLQEQGGIAWFVLDYVCDLIFLLDICVQFRTEYLEHGILVKDGMSLAKNYVRSRSFALDVLAMTPTDFLYFLDTTRLHPICRFPRLLKGYRMVHFNYMAEGRASLPALLRVFNICHLLLLLVHWLAAFYFLLCESIGFGSGDWVYPAPVGEYNSTVRMYLMSFYWSTLTLTLLGDIPVPDSEWEYIFQIISYLVGVMFFATIVGQVGIVIENRNALRLEFERHVDSAKKYMTTYNVAKDVQHRVLLWYFYTWKRSKTDVNSLGPLPTKLRAELAMHVHLKTLKKVSIFTACPPEFLHDLVLKMHLCIYTPGDLVCRRGEVAREMFIISDGLLEVVRSDGEILTTLQPGDFFGEIAILNLEGIANRRTADVRSVGYSELFTLSKGDVLDALTDFPQAQKVLEEEARRRLSVNRKSPPLRTRKRAVADLSCTEASDAERPDAPFTSNSKPYSSPGLQSLGRELGAGGAPGGAPGSGGAIHLSPSPSPRTWRQKPAVPVKPSRRKRGSKGSLGSTKDHNEDEIWVADVIATMQEKLKRKLEQSSRENQQLVSRIQKLEDELRMKERERDKNDSEIKELRNRVIILEDLLETMDVNVA